MKRSTGASRVRRGASNRTRRVVIYVFELTSSHFQGAPDEQRDPRQRRTHGASRRWSKPAHLVPPEAPHTLHRLHLRERNTLPPKRLLPSGAILSGAVYRNQNSPGRSSKRPTLAHGAS